MGVGAWKQGLGFMAIRISFTVHKRVHRASSSSEIYGHFYPEDAGDVGMLT